MNLCSPYRDLRADTVDLSRHHRLSMLFAFQLEYFMAPANARRRIKEFVVVYTYFRAYINLKFKHAFLGIHLSFSWLSARKGIRLC